MNNPFLSIVIPTYNRKQKVINAIDSALQFSNLGITFEIIIADDASTDNTIEFLNEKYAKEMDTGLIKLVASSVNLGASGAKNLAAGQSEGTWIVFLDSDDLLIEAQLADLVDELKRNQSKSIIFFRSIDLDTGILIGPTKENVYDLDVNSFIEEGTPGECLPVVSNVAFRRFNYISSLRGCEGLAYAKIIRSMGKALVSNIVTRKYDTSDIGRLSVGDGFNSRSCEIAKYHFIILTQFFKYLSHKKKFKSVVAVAYYILKCFLWRISTTFKIGKKS